MSPPGHPKGDFRSAQHEGTPVNPTRRPPPYSHSLLRVLAAYLVAIVLVQALAAAFALGAGPLHRHRPLPQSMASVLFLHHDRAHTHASGQRHHHAVHDSTVDRDAAEQEAADAARLALTAAFSQLALQTPQADHDLRSHVMRAALVWSWQPAWTLPLYRPPRQG